MDLKDRDPDYSVGLILGNKAFARIVDNETYDEWVAYSSIFLADAYKIKKDDNGKLAFSQVRKSYSNKYIEPSNDFIVSFEMEKKIWVRLVPKNELIRYISPQVKIYEVYDCSISCRGVMRIEKISEGELEKLIS